MTRADGAAIPEDHTIILYGASGDLARRKLLPGLFHLERAGLMPERYRIVGTSRRGGTDDDFRAIARDAIGDGADEDAWERFAGRLAFSAFRTDEPAPLREAVERGEEDLGDEPRRLHYLSIPPGAFGELVTALGESGLADRSRVVLEKPFGVDLDTAQALNRDVHETLDERQIYRIDHYLGKETVQNLLVFRFANGIFEPIWNNRFVDHVQITGAESIGVEARGGYFEQAGSMRDMVQNHLLQVLSLFAMEPPVAFDPDAVRDEKLKVLKALRYIPASDFEQYVVRAQYAAGSSGGQAVRGYREEPNVSPTSTTETFVALKLFIDSWRWAGVPFYLRSGKRLPKRVTEIAVFFKEAPHLLFGRRGESIRPNVLAIRIQPDEGIALNFGSKLPGPAMEIAPVSMEFRYGSSFGVEPPEAYERLLLDCLLGDMTLFTRADEVEASWAWVSRIHRRWAEDAAQQESGRAVLPSYPAGSWGPAAAEKLMTADGRAWRLP